MNAQNSGVQVAMQPTIVQISNPGRIVKFPLPLPRGFYHWSQSSLPIRVFDRERELPCQVERQTRHPDGSASSVYVFADAGEGNAPTDVRVEFEQLEQRSERDYPPFVWHPKLREIRQSLEFAVDRNGRMRPPTMNGPVVVERRLKGSLSWARFFTGSPEVLITTLVHNATIGAADEPLVDVNPIDGAYWEATFVTGPGSIDYLEQGPMRARQGVVMRYVLHPHFVTPSTAFPTDGLGVPTDAWQGTDALAPHFVRCADLSSVFPLNTTQAASYAVLKGALDAGTRYPTGSNYAKSRRIGFLHPGYSTEGGETSGYQIDFGDGQFQGWVETCNAAVIERAIGEQYVRLSRDAWLILDEHNEPATWERYAPNDVPIAGWRLSIDDPGKFDSSSGKVLDGPFGYSTAIPPTHVDLDLADLKAFETTDWGHIRRSAQWDELLALAINCPASRFLVRARGELARMAWNCGGHKQTDLAWSQHGLGVNRDRILGCQLLAISMAYCWGNNALRTRFMPDMHDAILVFAQSVQKSPTICSIRSGKQADRAPYNKLYGVCVQPTGECQLAFGFASLNPGDTSVLTKAAGSIEWLRHGGNVCWSAATYLKATSTSPDVTLQQRDDTLSSVTWPSAQYDSEQALGVLGLAGLKGVDVLPTLKALLGPNPLATLMSKGTAIVDTDLHAVTYLQGIQ